MCREELKSSFIICAILFEKCNRCAVLDKNNGKENDRN